MSKVQSAYWCIQEINFQVGRRQGAVGGSPEQSNQVQESRKGRILDSQKCLDTFAAQLQFV